MDISKQPIKTDLGLSAKIDPSIAQKSIITDIQDLKLEAGKIYTARVIQAKDAPQVQVASEETLKLLKEQAPTETKTKAISTNEWLILVKGKVALISSEKPLETGQKLLLKLELSGTTEKPSLIAQLVNNKSILTTQGSSQTLAPSQPLVQAASPAQIKQNQQVPAAQLDSANIKVLLQALNLTLDKQLPLQQGLQQLNNIVNQASTSHLTVNQLKIVETIKTTLIDKLPSLAELNKLDHQAKTPTNNAIKQSLLDSGNFLEKNLLSHPEKLIAFKEKLNALATLVAPERLSNKEGSLIMPSTSTMKTANGVNATNLSENKLSTPVSMQSNYGSAIQKIQQTIDHLLQLASSKAQTSPSLKSLDSSPSSYSDLKANLLSVSSLLAKQLSTELSDTQLKSIFLGATSEQYSISPFAFPILPQATTSTASKALFDKQEFSTGQILKLLAGMIHKLQFNQLHSLLHSNTNSDNPLQQTWFFELPVLNTNQNIETFNFRIDKEPQDTKDEENTSEEKKFQWKLLLSFDLDSLGPIYVLVKLSQNHVSSELWADKDSTLSLLQKESTYFKSQLEKIGLTVSEILCKKGQPTQIKTTLDRHLVDTKV